MWRGKQKLLLAIKVKLFHRVRTLLSSYGVVKGGFTMTGKLDVTNTEKCNHFYSSLSLIDCFLSWLGTSLQAINHECRMVGATGEIRSR